MASTVSVSKGVFVFKNGAKAASKKSRKKNKHVETYFCDSLWYRTYKDLWREIESRIQDLNNDMFSNVLGNLVNYVKDSHKNVVTEIPAAALLTGINMPDHSAQFKTLQKEIKKYVTPNVATLRGEDCQNLKYLVEVLVKQLVSKEDEMDDEDFDEETRSVKKYQCNFSYLQSWYEELYVTQKLEKSSKKPKVKDDRRSIVVILPDFENFTPKVVQDFILIVSSYINILPFIIVFGVATSLSTVHRTLPCHVSSKINIQVFHSSPSTVYLNNILENILFSSDCPFHLGGKVFNLFTDIFLFYDLSVSGFIQNFKYAMLEHFSYGNAMALCRKKKFKKVLEEFTHDDFENVRQLLTFRRLVEREEPEVRIRLIDDDEYFKPILRKEIRKIADFIPIFYLFLKCLHVLVADLPKAPLGKQVRELYAVALSKDITTSQEYTECFQLLSFQSRDELANKLKSIQELLVNNMESKLDQSIAETIVDDLGDFLDRLDNLDLEPDTEEAVEADSFDTLGLDRTKLKERLLQMSKQSKPLNKYERLRSKILDFLHSQFKIYLVEPSTFNFYEIFFFNDVSIQSNIIGSHRAAIHTALNDPYHYLQCSCCQIANDSIILSSMPDISIVYKLHLECGKMINLYDWLQSFLCIVDPQENNDASKKKVNPILQARFTQAVAELEYLGFVKSSKRKTDHVARLTWGG